MIDPAHLTQGEQSPFSSPGVQFAWDSTSLGYFKECPRKYYYTMIEGWRGGGSSVHLEFGGLYHSGLELYDHQCADGKSHTDAQRAMVRWALESTWERPEEGPGNPVDWGHNLKTRANLVRSLVWYTEHFRDDPAKTVILDNGKPAVELSFRFDAGDGILLCGHLDRVVEWNGSKFVMDRKTTTSTISSYYFDNYTPDNQMSLYTLAGRVILDSPVRGVIIDAVQIAVGFTRFERGMAYRTDDQLEEWLAATKDYIVEAQMRGDESTRVGESAFPMNDKACHNYGGCPFRSICGADPRVRSTFLESNFKRNPWNPLRTR
jgi:hypothetical protein